jgi:hypothetical protein
MRAWLGTALLAAAACREPLIPDRSGYYSFADTLPKGTDSAVSIFSWPSGRLPVRYWADPRGNMAFLVQRGIGVWEEQFLYGEFRGTLVADSGAADVIVRWADSVPPDVPPDTSHEFACGGVTVYDTDSAGTALSGPIHMELSVNRFTSYTAAQVQACMRRVAIHELGHTLGMLRHSPNSADIMHASPTADLPSSVDRYTVEVLYHTSPTVAPPPHPANPLGRGDVGVWGVVALDTPRSQP